MCKFCKAMQAMREAVPALYVSTSELRHSVAVITRFVTQSDGCYTYTDDCHGDGYALNFCPECGRQLTRKEDGHG